MRATEVVLRMVLVADVPLGLIVEPSPGCDPRHRRATER